MIRIELDDLYKRVEEMVERATAGEIVVITRNGRAVAQLEPMPRSVDRDPVP